MVAIIAVLFLLMVMNDPSIIVYPVLIALGWTVLALPFMAFGASNELAFALAPVLLIVIIAVALLVDSIREKRRRAGCKH